MAAKNKLKIGKRTLKALILEMSVDEGGRKVSDRCLWSSEAFKDKTGLFKINAYTKEKEACSLGTISYYKKLLGLRAEDVFNHHQFVTGLIDPLTLFSEWNLKSAVKSLDNGVVSEKTKKTNLIRDFELSDGKYMNTYTLRELENAIIELYNEFGLDGATELKEYYKVN